MSHSSCRSPLSLALLVLVSACADNTDAPTVGAPDGYVAAASFSQRPAGSERAASRRLGLAIAHAMREQSVRQYVKQALAASRVKEQKLHFTTFLSGRGGPLAEHILRSQNIHDDELGVDIAKVRDLEFYMPVGAHREIWTGGEAPLVAVALTEEEPPVAFDEFGAEVTLDRRFAPRRPVLVLAPAEADFAIQRKENLQGRAERTCTVGESESLDLAAKTCRRQDEDGIRMVNEVVPDSLEGIYVTQIEFLGDECGKECWFWGDPEYEMHIASNALTGASSTIQRCASDYNVGGVSPNDAPWHYDQNGRVWAGKVRILTASDVQLLEDAGDGTFAITFWEDDNARCLIYHDQTLSALVTESVAVNGAYIGTKYAIAALRVVGIMVAGITAIVTVWGATNGDDFIGVGIDRSETSFTSNKNFAIVAAGMQPKGFAMIKPYSINGVLPGPVSTVLVSGINNNGFLPYNTAIQMYAYGIDSYETPVPDRPVSWSSSNTSAATITAGGWLAGVSPGQSTVTAMIDGVSKEMLVTVGLAASTVGPTFMSPWQYGEWTVSISGGLGPYTIDWYIDDSYVGSGPSAGTYFQASTQHGVRAEVLDANGHYAQTDPGFTVIVNTGTGPYCDPSDPSCSPCDPESDPSCGEYLRAGPIDRSKRSVRGPAAKHPSGATPTVRSGRASATKAQ